MGMLCKRAEELYSDYIDGTIQKSLRVPLESHLQECAHCRTQVDELRRVWKVLDVAPVVEPPADFREEVWRRIDAAEQVRQPRPRLSWRALFTRPVLGWAAAALLLVVLAGVVVPGQYKSAWMLWPLNLFSSKEKAPWGITIGQPQMVELNGQPHLQLPLISHTSEPVEVRIEPMGEAAAIVEHPLTVRLHQGQVQVVSLPLRQLPNASIVLSVKGLGPYAGHQENVTVTLPLR
jgi:predicted anti-sigma-YlaC factor YlaD